MQPEHLIEFFMYPSKLHRKIKVCSSRLLAKYLGYSYLISTTEITRKLRKVESSID